MAKLSIHQVKIAGIAAAVPSHRVANAESDLLSERDRRLLVKTTGIAERRIAPVGMCASDLCAAAAQKLLTELGWEAETIEAIVFVSQTPDYAVPGSATQLQQRLGLNKQAACIDINQGCAGYVYGLATLAALQAAGRLKRTLLLVGDTITHLLGQRDKSTVPIFSDAGSATALEFDPEAAPIHFNLQSDGAGHQAIYVPGGGARNPVEAESLAVQQIGKGIERHALNLAMSGLDVFNFALKEVAPNIRELLSFAGKEITAPDHFVFHQANLLLNESIRKKLGVPAEKVPYSLREYGNTSCATLPVTMVAQLREALQAEASELLLSGFGIGLSWGSALLQTDRICCPEMIELSHE